MLHVARGGELKPAKCNEASPSRMSSARFSLIGLRPHRVELKVCQTELHFRNPKP